MIEKELKVENTMGVHARPSCLIATTATKFKSEIKLENKSNSNVADAKSVMSVMMLFAVFESVIKLTVEGEDEEEAAVAIEKLFKDKFSEAY